MAKSTFVVRRVKTKEDRKRPSIYTRLKEGDAFTAYALFEPDPEADDNPGYMEYYCHSDKANNRFYIPCAGPNCPFCAVNDNPSTRAITAWYYPDAEKGEQIKLFEANFGTTQLLDDESEEEDGILGKKLRIKRLDDRGNYTVRVKKDKPLTAKDQKRLLAELEEKFDFESMLEKRMRAELDRMQAADALEDDDDEDDDDDEEETETPKSKRTGKAKASEIDDDEDDDDDDEDEEDDDDDSDDSEDEDDDEEDDDEEESDDDEDDEDGEAEELTGNFTVAKVANEEDGILNLVNADGEKFKMYIAEDVEIDYDEVKKDTEVTLTAQQDEEGDWIITEIAVAKPKRQTRAPRGRKTTKK